MARIKICLGILATLIGIGIFSGIWVGSQCKSLSEDIAAISEQLSLGRTEDAAELAKKMEKKWEGFRSSATVLINNSRLTEIDMIVCRIAPMINDNCDEASAELEELSIITELLRKSEIPLLSSIL